MRAQTDLFLLGLARAAAGLWFRDVQVVGRDRLPAEGPTVVVASHFNGMLDPVLVAQSSARMPRFLAKADFWRNPVAGRLLDLVGALPVQRATEGSTEANRQIFEACHEALVEGQLIALFPEGITHDEPRVAQLRTGAARIALGARDAGARRLRIVPVGLIYSAKQRPRSRALVRIGEPIDLDVDLAAILAGSGADPAGGGALGGADAEDVETVQLLTEEIRRRLAEAALDYEHADVALAAAHAAAVALRPLGARRRWSPAMHDLERCARSIVAAPDEAQLAVIGALSLYADELALLGVTDADLVAGDLTRAALRFQLGRLAAYTAATPVAALGTAINGPAIGAVWAAGYLPVSTPMRATARLLTGLVLLPATWGLLRWWLGRRTDLREPTLWTLLAGPGSGLVALGLVERLRALRTGRASLARLREHAAVVPTLWASRAAVVEAVAEALAASEDHDLRRAIA
jgi:glycerol-3-phosphate O-acyltransferase / dihydroxyacetone phosphate acyltransferase